MLPNRPGRRHRPGATGSLRHTGGPATHGPELSLGASQIAEAIHAPETVTDQALRVLERVGQKMNDR